MSKPRKFSFSDCLSVRSLYNNFLRSATDLIGSHGVEFNPRNLDEILSVELKSADRIAVKTNPGCGFLFSGLPRKKGNKSNVIDVCIGLHQQIAPGDRTGLVILTSNVHVSYFECIKPGKYKILESWHFDFAPSQPGHPVFHAQLTEDHRPESTQVREYNPQRRVPALKDLPRVPTPPLDLAAIMEIIVADHLIEYREIVDSDDWKKAAERLPQLPMDHLTSWSLPVNKLKARHWYPVA